MNGAVSAIFAEWAAAGFKLADLARESGVNAATLWRLKRGAFEPRQATLRALEDALKRRTGQQTTKAA
jgi:transcriptional regulator with XRE-family HTH domain